MYKNIFNKTKTIISYVIKLLKFIIKYPIVFYHCIDLRLNRFIIDIDLSVSINGDVHIKKRVDKLPIKFKYIGGTFSCTGLKSLKNTPDVCLSFKLINGDIDSLENSPIYCKYIEINNCNLTSIEGVSIYIQSIIATNNKISDIKYLVKLNDLQFLNLDNNNITEISHLPDSLQEICISNNMLIDINCTLANNNTYGRIVNLKGNENIKVNSYLLHSLFYHLNGYLRLSLDNNYSNYKIFKFIDDKVYQDINVILDFGYIDEKFNVNIKLLVGILDDLNIPYSDKIYDVEILYIS